MSPPCTSPACFRFPRLAPQVVALPGCSDDLDFVVLVPLLLPRSLNSFWSEPGKQYLHHHHCHHIVLLLLLLLLLLLPLTPTPTRTPTSYVRFDCGRARGPYLKSDAQTLRRSDTQTLRRSDTQTLRHSDAQTLRHSDTYTIEVSL